MDQEGAAERTHRGGNAIPAEMVRFAELFRDGRYWESHEVLEEPWREDGSVFYHGLILLASAWVHVQRGNPHGIDAQLRKALAALDGVPSPYLGVDVEALRAAARRGRRVVADQREAPGPDDSWVRLLPPPELVLDPRLLRGDEPELARAPARDRPSSPPGSEDGDVDVARGVGP